MPSAFEKRAETGIKVIVVGAGFAGLTAAIECDRKGHSVILLEKVKELKPLGDLISFGSNAGRFFERWGNVMETLEPLLYNSPGISYHDWTGRYVTTQTWEKHGGRNVSGHRGEIHLVILQHALDRGIDVRLGHSVEEFFEDGKGAGVVVNGERLTADCVVIAEGVKSLGRKSVLGYEDLPKPSGYAVYRAWYDSQVLAKNDLTKHLVINGDTHTGWIGRDKHFLATSLKNGKDFSWVLTHKDSADIKESWQNPGRVEDVLKELEDWDPLVHELVKATPADSLVDYKLVFRDPLPTFISPKARIALIGDAAHPFLPTSIQGASQAVEDGVTIAVCLEKGRKDNIALALKAYEAIRYERVHRVQQMGVTTREQWHLADWDKIWKNPESLHIKREPWLLGFNAEAHAYECFDATAAKIREESLKSVDGEVVSSFINESVTPKLIET